MGIMNTVSGMAAAPSTPRRRARLAPLDPASFEPVFDDENDEQPCECQADYDDEPDSVAAIIQCEAVARSVFADFVSNNLAGARSSEPGYRMLETLSGWRASRRGSTTWKSSKCRSPSCRFAAATSEQDEHFRNNVETLLEQQQHHLASYRALVANRKRKRSQVQTTVPVATPPTPPMSPIPLTASSESSRAFDAITKTDTRRASFASRHPRDSSPASDTDSEEVGEQLSQVLLKKSAPSRGIPRLSSLNNAMDKFELTKRTSSAVGHQDQYEPQSQTQDLAQNWRDIQRCLADAGRT